jgi:hypothetical protein
MTNVNETNAAARERKKLINKLKGDPATFFKIFFDVELTQGQEAFMKMVMEGRYKVIKPGRMRSKRTPDLVYFDEAANVDYSRIGLPNNPNDKGSFYQMFKKLIKK